MTEMHPDPVGDTGQKAAQYVQLVVMAAEALAVIAGAKARVAAERDEAKTAEIAGQLAANHKAAAALWEPVLADHERSKLDVAQTLTAWSAAQGWRESDPAADRATGLAEERLHETRPAAMMRYDELRSQGFDPVSAMRQVVPMLESNPRIGEPGVRAGALEAVPVVEALADPRDAGRLPDTAAARALADELDAEHDGYEPPYGLSGYELSYGVPDRMADGPHRGWDGRDVDDLHEELASTAGGTAPSADPWLEAPTGSQALQPSDLEVAAATTALLVGESALLTDIEAHRAGATRHDRLDTDEQLAVRDLRASRDADAVAATGRHLSRVGAAGAQDEYVRTAAQALSASFPDRNAAVAPAPAVAAAAPMNTSSAAAQVSLPTAKLTARPRPHR